MNHRVTVSVVLATVGTAGVLLAHPLMVGGAQAAPAPPPAVPPSVQAQLDHMQAQIDSLQAEVKRLKAAQPAPLVYKSAPSLALPPNTPFRYGPVGSGNGGVLTLPNINGQNQIIQVAPGGPAYLSPSPNYSNIPPSRVILLGRSAPSVATAAPSH